MLNQKPHLSENIARTIQLMRDHFEEAWVTDYDNLIDGIAGMPDDDDRHVVAAAIKCGAQQIVTNNLRHFPEAALDAYSLEAVSADAFLSGTFELYPGEALNALRAIRGRYRNPAYTRSEFVYDLTANGMPRLASLLKPHVDGL